MVFGAITWVAQVRSDYDALRMKVNAFDLKLGEAAAECEVGDARLLKQLKRTEHVNRELRASIERLLSLQPSYARSKKAYEDAKNAVERAKALQSEENWP